MEPKITFRLPQDLYDKAKDKAQSEDITLSQALRHFLRDWVEEAEPPTLPDSGVRKLGIQSGGNEPGAG